MTSLQKFIVKKIIYSNMAQFSLIERLKIIKDYLECLEVCFKEYVITTYEYKTLKEPVEKEMIQIENTLLIWG